MIKSIRVQLLPNNKQKTKLFQFAGAVSYFNLLVLQDMLIIGH